MANEPFLTFLVITDPAPIIEFLFSFNGATSDELDPTKTLLLELEEEALLQLVILMMKITLVQTLMLLNQ